MSAGFIACQHSGALGALRLPLWQGFRSFAVVKKTSLDFSGFYSKVNLGSGLVARGSCRDGARLYVFALRLAVPGWRADRI